MDIFELNLFLNWIAYVYFPIGYAIARSKAVVVIRILCVWLCVFLLRGVSCWILSCSLLSCLFVCLFVFFFVCVFFFLLLLSLFWHCDHLVWLRLVIVSRFMDSLCTNAMAYGSITFADIRLKVVWAIRTWHFLLDKFSLKVCALVYFTCKLHLRTFVILYSFYIFFPFEFLSFIICTKIIITTFSSNLIYSFSVLVNLNET